MMMMNKTIESNSPIFNRHLDDFQRSGIEVDIINESMPTIEGYGFMVDHDEEGLNKLISSVDVSIYVKAKPI